MDIHAIVLFNLRSYDCHVVFKPAGERLSDVTVEEVQRAPIPAT